MRNNNRVPEVGDYVIGRTLKGGILVKGFITRKDDMFQEIKVFVVESQEDPKLVGKERVLQGSLSRKLDDYTVDIYANEESLLAIIDAALAAGDKQWFEQLSQRLVALRNEPAL